MIGAAWDDPMVESERRAKLVERAGWALNAATNALEIPSDSTAEGAAAFVPLVAAVAVELMRQDAAGR